MTRRERLAAARERDGQTYGKLFGAAADRRFLLGLVDELAAALGIAAGDLEFMQSSGQVMFPVLPAARAMLSDLGPDA